MDCVEIRENGVFSVLAACQGCVFPDPHVSIRKIEEEDLAEREDDFAAFCQEGCHVEDLL